MVSRETSQITYITLKRHLVSSVEVGCVVIQVCWLYFVIQMI